MKLPALSIILMSLCLPKLALAEYGEPVEHSHKAGKQTLIHYLSKSEEETPHSHNKQKPIEGHETADSHATIVNKNITHFERVIGSYTEYETATGVMFSRITFRSTNMETGVVILGVAEVPVDQCENKTTGSLYLAYNGFSEGQWYEFDRDDEKAPIIPLTFERHICKLNKPS